MEDPQMSSVVETSLGILCSGFFSWLFTFLYYRKSLAQQAGVSSDQISQLLAVAANEAETIRQMLMQRRMEESIKEYRHAGTPLRTVASYTDLSDAEKADLFDAVLLRVKGRKARSNPFRSNSTA